MNPEPRPPSPRILIVDDEQPVVDLFMSILREHDFDVCGVSDPRVAIETARKFLPHLVLTDLDMPGLDGSELCTLLKSYPETSRAPVVFVSGRTLEEDHDLGRFSGAVSYLDKPVEAEVLVRTVRNILGCGKKGLRTTPRVAP